jgi:serine/threonine-protein kinase RIO1
MQRFLTLVSNLLLLHRLYVTARLVHGDLSEYNILVCPADLVENKDDVAGAGEDGKAIQAVFIDFGQAVDVHHPSAKELLVLDLSQIRRFFSEKGTKTLGSKMALEFVTKPEPYEGEQPKAEHPEAESTNPAEEVQQPGLMVNANSSSARSSRSAGSSHKVDALKQPGRMVSVNSSSSRSSGRSSAGSYDVNGQQPSRMASVASTRTASTHSTSSNSVEVEASDVVAKELKKEKKKDKKMKKEAKKKKRDKKEPSSSSAKRKTKLVEPITQTPPSNVDEQLFSLNGVAPNSIFGGLGDVGGDVDWEAEWNEEFSVKNTPSLSS